MAYTHSPRSTLFMLCLPSAALMTATVSGKVVENAKCREMPLSPAECALGRIRSFGQTPVAAGAWQIHITGRRQPIRVAKQRPHTARTWPIHSVKSKARPSGTQSYKRPTKDKIHRGRDTGREQHTRPNQSAGVAWHGWRLGKSINGTLDPVPSQTVPRWEPHRPTAIQKQLNGLYALGIDAMGHGLGEPPNPPCLPTPLPIDMDSGHWRYLSRAVASGVEIGSGLLLGLCKDFGLRSANVYQGRKVERSQEEHWRIYFNYLETQTRPALLGSAVVCSQSVYCGRTALAGIF
ncbi:uncharacterized protein CLUP02_09941 [Colletotrichum lupini]|uniref:Uncharacterized protein n=1 Tax=Colletotrichum lupini TaxID=145971 RepID=A0A9Q8WIB0_9PEZI|nr:uncharacterized protein CLUP02_09941 [Colletotrichum lupini]UQC84444.1 hypothetical protein CLUP02_09941 [Colletotrichum lupini]